MNENVTIKTPKRRRWIARLLVSALCILLASSLLFVGVVAENIVLVAQFSSSKAISSDSFNGVIPLNGTDLLYWNGSVIFISSTFGNSSFSYPYENYNRLSCAVEGSFLYVASCDDEARVRITCYDISDIFSFFEVYSEVVVSRYTGQWGSSVSYGPVIAVEEGNVYGVVGYWGNSDNYNHFASFVLYSNGDEISFPLFSYSFVDGTNSAQVIKSNCLFYDGCLYIPCLGLCYDFVSGSRLSVSDSYTSLVTVFRYENNVYALSSSSIFLLDPNTRSFSCVGVYSGYTTSAYANDGILTAYGSASNGSVPYTVYTGLPTPEPPPESSDDSSDETTTEPPPESSDGSSADPSAETKIWKVDSGLVESYVGSIDLTDATRIRAFLGVFTSSGSSFVSDRAVPLTIEVYRNGLDSPDTYTFDFFAYGWGATSNGFPNSYDSYTFPDVVGLYYDIPIPADGEGLLFPTFAPYGSIYVNFSDSVFPDDIQRVTFNLHNSQGYLDVNFISSSSTSFTIYNDDLTKGKTYTFDSGTFNYKCFFDLDGEYSETEWFSPQFGSSIKYSAEDVLESGLYAIYSFNDDSIEYPWGNGEWSEAISNANSRLDQVSLDYEILESKANEAYGQFSFNSMTGQDFIGAVSNFESIKDSSGGSYILDYFFGMWNVHPFASSMIAIVGTLAIVGFIIRKL